MIVNSRWRKWRECDLDCTEKFLVDEDVCQRQASLTTLRPSVSETLPTPQASDPTSKALTSLHMFFFGVFICTHASVTKSGTRLRSMTEQSQYYSTSLLLHTQFSK